MGNSMGPGPGQSGSSPIKDATRGIERKVAETENTTQDLLELRHADKRLTDQLVKGALIAKGGINIDANGEALSSNSDDDAAVGRKDSKTNQALSGATAVLLSTLWTAYFHEDMDPALLGSVIVLIMAAGQAVPTLINNRKAK